MRRVVCSHLGLPGWPAIAELMVFRDIELCRLVNAAVHFLHLSTAAASPLVHAAKADGLAVTAEPRRTTSRSPTRR